MNISSTPRTIAGDNFSLDRVAASSGQQSRYSRTTILSAATATSPPPSSGGSSSAAFSVTAAIGGLLLLLTMVVGGPLACLCYVTLQVRRLRQKAKEARSVIFASQWRAENPFVQEVDMQVGPEEDPKGEMQLCGSGKGSRMQEVGLTGWNFTYTPVPADFNGVSTALFQSPPPVISPSSTLFPGQEEIRFNPGIRHQRQEQCVQCARPLMPYDNSTADGESARDAANQIITISYFEVTILAFSRDGHVALTAAGRPMEDVNLAVGLAARPAPPFRLPGRDPVSIALHSKTGRLFVNDLDDGQPLADTWSAVGATVGCGYHMERGVVFFTKDDQVAQAQSSTSGRGRSSCLLYRTGYPVPATPDSLPLFPTIGCDADVTVVVNFGQRGFKFLNNIKLQEGRHLPNSTQEAQL